MHHSRWIVFVAGLALMSPRAARACGFIESGLNVVTLRKDAAESQLVLCVHLEDAQVTPEKGSTKLVISAVLKTHPVLDGRKILTIPKYVPIDDPKNPPNYLAFADVIDGSIDVYRIVPKTEAVLDYVKGLMKFDGKDRGKILHYCADYLENKDRVIADDAYAEFMQSPDKVIGEVAKKLSAKTLRCWVQDKQTPRERLRLYGFLLGNCGGDEDAKALHGLLEQLMKEKEPAQIDGILTGYTLLKPKEGWDYVRAQMKDADRPFIVRYHCLRAARFFHTTRPDVLAEKDIIGVMELGIDQSDIADIPIYWLGRWGYWQLTDRILALYDRKEFDVPVVRRGIVNYALRCPGKKAAEFVAAQRKADPEFVEGVEEALKDTLRLEEEAAKKQGGRQP